MSERTRCFLAFALPAGLIRCLGEVQRDLMNCWPKGVVRWVVVENLHLTLRFFGDLDAEQIGRVVGVLKSEGTRWVPVAVRLSRVSAFPSVSRPRVIWIGLSSSATEPARAGGVEKAGQATEGPADELTRIAGEIDGQLQRVGFPPPDKPWKSHVTLGRVGRAGSGGHVRSPRGWERARGTSPAGQDGSTRGGVGAGGKGTGNGAEETGIQDAEFELTSLVLMKSELQPSGAVYTPLCEVCA